MHNIKTGQYKLKKQRHILSPREMWTHDPCIRTVHVSKRYRLHDTAFDVLLVHLNKYFKYQIFLINSWTLTSKRNVHSSTLRDTQFPFLKCNRFKTEIIFCCDCTRVSSSWGRTRLRVISRFCCCCWLGNVIMMLMTMIWRWLLTQQYMWQVRKERDKLRAHPSLSSFLLVPSSHTHRPARETEENRDVEINISK